MPLSSEDYERVIGDSPLLAIEAAAGAGKTHLACELAVAPAFVGSLQPHEAVLFLSHTNAARDVFRRRVTGSESARQRVVQKTLDTFCLELLSPYAALWGLPVPLRTPYPMPREWFADIRRKAAILLRRKRTLASAVAARFPLILADEHQDASWDHHSVLQSLAGAGARVRMFGDGLQAILTFDRNIPGWDALVEGIPTIELSGSWRWVNSPRLGEWISMARACLRQGRPVPLSNPPSEVQVVVANTPPGARWCSSRDTLDVLRHLSALPSLAVLGRRNDDVREIARDPALCLIINEGSDFRAVEEVIVEVIAAGGSASGVATAVADFMIGIGELPPAVAEAIRSLDAMSALPGVAEIVAAIDGQPDLNGLALGLRTAKRMARRLEWAVAQPVALQIVAALPPLVGSDDVMDLVYQAQRTGSEGPIPPRCASTIHKAKGREFDHVVIPCVDAGTFRTSREDQQLFYVALSRATQAITLIVPYTNPSPLISL